MKKYLAIMVLTGAALMAARADARGFIRGPHVWFGPPACWDCAYFPPYYSPAWYPPYYYGPTYSPPSPPHYYQSYNNQSWRATSQPDETDYELPDNVLFTLDSAKISENADVVISQIARAARKESNATLIVEGHTDTSGERAHNQQLSQARARAVEELLVRDGVPRNLIRAEGLGEFDLAVQTGPGVRDMQNRRVIVRLIHNSDANHQVYRNDHSSDDERN